MAANRNDQPAYVIGFMFVAMLVFSLALIGLAAVTRERVEQNAQLALEEAVVRVLPIELPEEMTNEQIHRAFVEQVEEPTAETGGAYVLREGGAVKGYAVPIAGQGFWAQIKGMLGVGADGESVTGIAFYEQNETPGLGAEIESISFRRQFEGKELSAGPAALEIVRPGMEAGPSEVHGVTGATQTSTRLGRLINESVQQWRERLGEEGG